MNESNATTELKLKARMTNVDELNYTIQVYPLNIEWKYAEPEYIINEHRFKNDSVRQIIRNVVLKYKDFMYGSIKVGSKDYLFEVQVPKGFDTGNLKQIITQIGTEIKDEIVKNENEIETFRKFLEETEF